MTTHNPSTSVNEGDRTVSRFKEKPDIQGVTDSILLTTLIFILEILSIFTESRTSTQTNYLLNQAALLLR